MAYLYTHIRLDLNAIFYIGIGEDISDHKQKYYRAYSKYDRNMNFIQEWPSIKEAKIKCKGDIQSCCSGRTKTAGGFIWKTKI
jgi:hypothetical protein